MTGLIHSLTTITAVMMVFAWGMLLHRFLEFPHVVHDPRRLRVPLLLGRLLALRALRAEPEVITWARSMLRMNHGTALHGGNLPLPLLECLQLLGCRLTPNGNVARAIIPL